MSRSWRSERWARVSYHAVSTYPSTTFERATSRLSAGSSVASSVVMRSGRALSSTTRAWGSGRKGGRVVTGVQLTRSAATPTATARPGRDPGDAGSRPSHPAGAPGVPRMSGPRWRRPGDVAVGGIASGHGGGVCFVVFRLPRFVVLPGSALAHFPPHGRGGEAHGAGQHHPAADPRSPRQPHQSGNTGPAQ